MLVDAYLDGFEVLVVPRSELDGLEPVLRDSIDAVEKREVLVDQLHADGRS